MRKGITPIISIIILLLITVALAGAAWTYMSGFMGTYIEKSFVIPTGGAYCAAGGIFHARVVNTGTTTIRTTDWTSVQVENSTYVERLAVTGDIGIKSTLDFTNTSAPPIALHGQGGASYTITVGTVAGVQRIPVVCP